MYEEKVALVAKCTYNFYKKCCGLTIGVDPGRLLLCLKVILLRIKEDRRCCTVRSGIANWPKWPKSPNLFEVLFSG